MVIKARYETYKKGNRKEVLLVITIGKSKMRIVQELQGFIGSDDPADVIKRGIRVLRQIKEGRKNIGK